MDYTSLLNILRDSYLLLREKTNCQLFAEDLQECNSKKSNIYHIL